MTCRHEQTSISALVDSELSEESARDVEARIEACSTCRDLLVSFREMGEKLTDALETETDPGFLVRFRARREELSVAPWWTWRQLAMRLLPPDGGGPRCRLRRRVAVFVATRRFA